MNLIIYYQSELKSNYRSLLLFFNIFLEIILIWHTVSFFHILNGFNYIFEFNYIKYKNFGNVRYLNQMYDEDLIRVVIKLYNNRKTNEMSIDKILQYSDIAISTMYQWINIYSDILSNRFTYRIIRLRSYNKETIYRFK